MLGLAVSYFATSTALHKTSWAVIDRPYKLGSATVGALYERPRSVFCAKPRFSLLAGTLVSRHCPPGGRCCKLAGHQKTYFNANCKIRESRAVRICPKVL